MGMGPEWIRAAILEGVPVQGRIVTLEAERLALNARSNTYRIYPDSFVVFLKAIGWKRLPHRVSPVVVHEPPPAGGPA
jgi:hypothetical protein